MIEAITFDFWNTLYKAPQGNLFLERRIEVFYDVLKEYGKEVKIDKIRLAVQKCWAKAHAYQREEGLEMTPRGHVDYILKELNILASKEQWDNLYHIYTSFILEDPPEVNDGVKETLEALQGKYKMAVICNTGVTPGVIIREVMKEDGIYDYFDYLTFSDEVGCAKPNPKIFALTLEKIGKNSSVAAHIGDDAITDVFGSKRAGMTSIWLAPLNEESVADADYHLRSFKELLNIL